MAAVILGSEAVAAGVLNPYALRTRYALLYPGVYVPRGTEVDAVVRAKAAWLWSRRRGVLVGNSAGAIHGAKWIDKGAPAELIYENRHCPSEIRTYADQIADDEITVRNGMRVAIPARVALDAACRLALDKAVAAIDALANATNLKMADVELLGARYSGRRGIRRAGAALDLVDTGAESPRETWLRLLLIRAGFPRPTTQICVRDEFGYTFARLDMGWEDVKIAAEYDGDQHRTSRRRFNRDIGRMEALAELGWIVIRVTSEDVKGDIIRRVESAFARRM